MSRVLRTRYDNSRCKACNKSIPYGTDVRHTGGYGVTCLGCPHGPDLQAQGQQQQPQQSTATLAGELISRCERECAEAKAETARYRDGNRAALDVIRTLQQQVAVLTAERDALLADRRVGPLAQLPPEALTEDRTDGYDRFLASSDGAPEVEIHPEESGSIEYDRASVVDADDDCPI